MAMLKGLEELQITVTMEGRDLLKYPAVDEKVPKPSTSYAYVEAIS